MMANAKGEGATGLPSKKRRWVPVSSEGGEEGGGGGEAERDRGIRVSHSSSSGCGSGSSSSSSSSSGSGNSFNEEKRRGETAHDGDDDGNGHGRSERGEIVGGHLPPPSPHHNSHLNHNHKHNRDCDRDHENDRGRGCLSSSLSSSSCSRSPSSSALLRGSSPPTTQKKLKFVLKVTPPSGSKPNSNVSEGQEEPKPETSKPDKEVPFSEELAKKILDTLQLKDIYKAFSNPVDSKEVPDYYNVIKNPMDFGTMRKKLLKGLYKSLNDFQEDISLICSNAMHFNAKDTVYYKQARAIQDTASKIIVVLRTQGVTKVEEVLRTFGGGGGSTTTKSKESPVAVPKRKYTKRSHIWKARLERRYGINSSGGQNSVSQRLGSCYDSTGLAHQSSDFHQFPTDDGNVDHYEDTAGKMSFKDNKKFQVNGLKRSSYCRRPNSSMIEKGILPWTCDGSIPQLTPTGYSMDYVYAKSLTRFAADLGPAFWKIAQGKVQRALPRGIPFGPGWVGEQEARLISHLFTNSQQQQKRQQQQPPSLPPSKDNREIKAEQQQPPSLPPSKDSREIKVEQQQQPNNPSQAKINQVMRCSKIDSSVCSSSITSNSRLALESAVSSQQPLQNSTLSNSGGEVTKLTLGAAGFTGEMCQSKLLEIMSQKNRLTTATKTASLPSSSRGKPIVADLNSAACELGKQPSEPVNGRSLWSIAQPGLERDSSQHLRLSEEQERIRLQAYLEAQKQSKSLAFPTSEQKETGQTAGKNGFQQQLSTSSFRRNDSSEASFLLQQQNLHKLQMAKAQQNPWLLPPSSGIQPANLNFLNISGQPSQKPWISSCSLLQTTHGLPQDLNTSLSDSKSSTETLADPPHPDLALQL